MVEMEKRKFISEDLRQMLLKLDRKEMDIKLFAKLFNRTYNMKTKSFTEPLIPRNHKMLIKPGEYCGNTEEIVTTPGAFIYNLLLCKDKCDHLLPNHFYSAWPITAKNHEKLLDIIYQGCITKKMTIEQLINFLNDMEFWGLKPSSMISSSFTRATTISHPEAQKLKKEMLAKIGNRKLTVNEMVEIEDAAVELSKRLLKNDPGADLYDSGSRGNWENDFKNNNVMVGAVANPQTGGFDFMESNYIDGISKKDIIISGNNIVNACFPKAVGTRVSGYSTKQSYAVYQSIVIDNDERSDCGSTVGSKVFLTAKNIDGYIFRFIINEHGGLTQITYENKSQFINKWVNMRSPMSCRNDKFCAVCAGTKWSAMEIENAGVSTARVTNGLLNASMKLFHKTKVELDQIDPDSLLI